MNNLCFVSGGQLFLINGPLESNYVQGFAISLDNQIHSRFGSGYLQYPHDIAASNDSSAIYIAELSPPRISKFVLEAGEKCSIHSN